MRNLFWLGLLVGFSFLQAQEESRHREGIAPPPPPPKPAQNRPTLPREEIVMEMISGTLLDKKEQPIPNARIWIVHKSTGKVLGETRSDASGSYAIAVPRVDTVILRVSVDGKAFMEKEYSFDSLLSSTEITFEP
jgi:hypothetical protein